MAMPNPIEASHEGEGEVDPCPLSIKKKEMVVPSSSIIIKFPWTYEKLHGKGEPYRFNGYRDSLAQTDILLLLYKDF